MTTTPARVRLSVVRPGGGRLVRVLPAEAYALETVAADVRAARADDRVEVRWEGPPSAQTRRFEERLVRLAGRGIDVAWIVDGEPGDLPRRSAKAPRSAKPPRSTQTVAPPAPELHRIGDLVSPADLPGPIACRVVAAESCGGDAPPDLQLLVLEPLAGPWAAGTLLFRTSDLVERAEATADAVRDEGAPGDGPARDAGAPGDAPEAG